MVLFASCGQRVEKSALRVTSNSGLYHKLVPEKKERRKKKREKRSARVTVRACYQRFVDKNARSHGENSMHVAVATQAQRPHFRAQDIACADEKR